MTIRKLLSEKSGVATIEMAFAMPVLVTIMIGTLQFALVLQASGAMRHGIGQGLRYAKVNDVSDPSDPLQVAALKDEVEDIVRDSLAGINPDGVKALKFVRNTDSSGTVSGTITMQYQLKPVIPFAAIPPIDINETRTAYLPS